jgi:predicted nuclease of predicted toxin-antitoxin system
MRFFLDNCVPDSVGRVLLTRGHEAIFQRDAIPKDASDKLVALASVENGAILISFDKDFKAIASRFHVSHGRLKKLSRIQFRCSEPKAASRLDNGLSLIEAEWSLCQVTADGRMFIEIQDNAFKTVR